MGRLSEFINGQTQNGASHVQISGVIENQEMFERLLTYEPNFDRNFRALIRKMLKEARKNLSKDAKDYINEDPRRAARAIKHTVYKQLFGGNLSILQKRTSGAPSKYLAAAILDAKDNTLTFDLTNGTVGQPIPISEFKTGARLIVRINE
jgi:hypothetical protein